MTDSSRHTDGGLGAKLKRLPAVVMLLVEKKLELWAIQLAETLAEKAAAAVAQLIGGLLLLSGLTFVLFGTALLLNELLDSTWAGFVVQGGVFLFFGLITMIWKNAFWRKSIQKSMSASLLNSMGYGETQQKLPSSTIDRSDGTR